MRLPSPPPFPTRRSSDLRRWSSPVFTTAHATFGDSARDYLNIRPKAQQPIDFPHKIHTDDIGVYCDTCHTGVSKGARAGIPRSEEHTSELQSRQYLVCRL